MELNVEQFSPAAGVLGQLMSSMTILDRALAQLSDDGLLLGGGRNIKVDQQRRIASFNGSSELRNVLVDGKKTDVRVNDIGFLVAGDRSVVYVQLLSLDIDGIGTSLFLKRLMDSLLFVI